MTAAKVQFAESALSDRVWRSERFVAVAGISQAPEPRRLTIGDAKLELRRVDDRRTSLSSATRYIGESVQERGFLRAFA